LTDATAAVSAAALGLDRERHRDHRASGLRERAPQRGEVRADVREAGDLSDYGGELELHLPVRVTDRASGASGGNPATPGMVSGGRRSPWQLAQTASFPPLVLCVSVHDG
jgi:hypothetical protein